MDRSFARVRTLPILVALFAALLLAVLAPADADAITKKRATQIAVQKLATKKAKQQRLVVFGMPKALAGRTVVTEAVKRPGTPRADAKAVGKRFWLFWADLRPHADFLHPSVLLLVDDESGRVIRRRKLEWWPLLNGKRPPFLRGTDAYDARRFRVFSNLTGPKRSRGSAAGAAWPVARASQITGPPKVPNDCMVVMADRHDASFGGSLRAIETVARSINLRRVTADNARGLRKKLKALKAGPPPCTDVVIVLVGHGSPAPGVVPDGQGGTMRGTRQPTVFLKTRRGKTSPFTAKQLRKILAENRDITFKLVVSACYSGRWVDALKDESNLRVAMASARADQLSYRFKVGERQPIGSQRNGVLTTSNTFVTVGGQNPFDARPIIARVFGGLSRWSASSEERERTGDDLGKGLAAGFRLGAQNDGGSQLGWQEAVISDHTATRPHRPPATDPPPQPPLEVSCTGGTQFVPNFPRELSYGFNCTSQGDNFDRFLIVFNQGGLNNRIPPSQQGTVCEFMTFEIPNDTEACVSPNFGTGMNINGRLAFGADVSCTTTADLIVANGSNDRHAGPFRMQMPFSCQ